MADANEKRYLDQVGLSALWDKIKNRDIALSGEISSLSSQFVDKVVGLDTTGVSGILPMDKGGLGTEITSTGGKEQARINLDVYSTTEVDSHIASAISNFGTFEIVSAMVNDHPDVSNPSDKIIYLYKDPSKQVTDPYTEWIWISATQSSPSSWDCIGETTMNLSEYVNSLTTASTGNAVTQITKIGNGITATFGETFATKSELDTVSGDLSGAIDDLSGTISSLDDKAFTAVSTAGTGNAFTTVSTSTNTITLTKGETFLPSAEFETWSAGYDDTINNYINNLQEKIDANSGDISEISSYIEGLNNNLTGVERDLGIVENRLTYITAFNGWQTITNISSTSAGIAFTAADIPAITNQEIDNLDNSWSPANNG